MKRFPSVESKLVIGEKVVGNNPKINNLVRGYDMAKYDVVWIADSNIYLEPTAMTEAMILINKPNVGCVHHIPIGVEPHSFGGLLEAVYMANYVGRNHVGINNTKEYLDYLGINVSSVCLLGKSYLFRKSDLECVGGLAHFGQYLGEDFMMGKFFAEKGFRLLVPTHLAYQTLGSDWVLSDYFLRRVRWGRIRKMTVIIGILLEPISGILGLGFMLSTVSYMLFKINPFIILGAHVVLWLIGDIIAFVSFSKQWPKFKFPWLFIPAWLLVELLFWPILIYILCGNTVNWRGKIFRLKWGGDAEPLN
eukprot:TRINITY_DN3278_c0_g1_i1.p1 TRINITY_DN3278_c0_g1~~TRINITY_DN3278_c0_g1_i1.p1  ORF type:complete len:306 (+),score=30.50 TRINITY_DN3278_c0_g1_i1:537-1454(+)